jgi:hypothetical protein
MILVMPSFVFGSFYSIGYSSILSTVSEICSDLHSISKWLSTQLALKIQIQVGSTAIYGILEFFGLHFNCQKNVKVKNKNISTDAL